MRSSRKGASPELVFLFSVFIIVIVLVVVYLYLAAQTVERSSYQVETSAGVIEIDRIVAVWAQGDLAQLAENTELVGSQLLAGFVAEGWCGSASCDEAGESFACEFDVFKSDCPVIGILSASRPYARTVFIPMENEAVPVRVTGRFDP